MSLSVLVSLGTRKKMTYFHKTWRGRDTTAGISTLVL